MILVFILTFTVIYAVFCWRQLNVVEKPLTEKLLDLDYIAAVNIDSSSNKIAVNICLEKVDNLPQLYKDVENTILASYEEDSVEIFFKDKRTSYLNSLYEEIHYSLMEGERLGNYSKMKQETTHILEQEQDLDFRLWVDQKRIYLLLSSEDSFLCEIIPLSSSAEHG